MTTMDFSRDCFRLRGTLGLENELMLNREPRTKTLTNRCGGLESEMSSPAGLTLSVATLMDPLIDFYWWHCK
ncbi:hypothetical protein BGZ61DRAFT_444434 [Ilyonectria robusta]|uniref:uncharacterized protein n=1 Tax=Ilyonectria robusta TaxID=1079257 RepID=UPI001E8CDBA9|nr:uncharacterized protein BGZ61DRAFT_444434 [Ilyonectria robusta]KAH8733389.1 hypothetical protein BGZ61DRAFT_444434 [Ilyonectria robusta]